MSVIDKVVAAITPPETADQRAEARAKARAAAAPGSWFAMVLDHHQQIEAAFADVFAATDSMTRAAAQKKLGTVLTGHSIAEEVAIYPALAAEHQVAHSELAYQEQSAAKMEMGLLERLDPMSQDYNDKLGHIHGAVMHHVYSEEGTWFYDLATSADTTQNAMITERYEEEYQRYMGADA